MRTKNEEIVQELIERGADINAMNNSGITALMSASFNGHIEVVKELIKRGADVNARKTALIYAKNQDIKKLLSNH